MRKGIGDRRGVKGKNLAGGYLFEITTQQMIERTYKVRADCEADAILSVEEGHCSADTLDKNDEFVVGVYCEDPEAPEVIVDED